MKSHAIILLLKSSLNSTQMRYKSRRLNVTWFILKKSPNKRNIQGGISKWEEGRYEILGAKNPGRRWSFVSAAEHFTVQFSGLFSKAIRGPEFKIIRNTLKMP